ncbi:MAG: TetR/AcrR family transcriptional regulator [Gammaproteobacteria bacterium]|nr:TetR/AcrR family transcriptional regulator [Gammaproteobacteria bacterium]
MDGVKEQILTCARDLFLAEGLSRFSMRKVASCAGVSATAIYRHYANREELLFHVLLRGFLIFADYLRRVDKGLDPLPLLEATAMAYLDFALSERAYYEMMFMSSEQITGLKQLSQDGMTEMRHTFEILEQRVQRAIDAGALKGDNSYRVAFGMWAYAHGQISLYLCGQSEMEKNLFINTYRELFASYIRC